MPVFQYKGRNVGGDLVTGRINAATEDAAAADLYGNSITPIEIRLGRTTGQNPGVDSIGRLDRLNAWLSRGRVDATDLVIFSRQMFSLSKAGLPLDRALRGLESSISNPVMKKILRDIAIQLEKGMNLTDALSRHPKVFSPLYLSLVNVGENTGRLDLAFEQVGKYMQLELDTAKQVKSATRYPMFVMIAIAIALSIITIFVIPVFADTFERLDAELPWQTLLLIAISDFAVNYWHWILAGMIAAFVYFRRYVNTDPGRLNWDRYKLQLPLVGSIFERIALSRFSRTFAMMMKSGVPVVQSLGVIARAVGNRYIGDNIVGMRDAISHGESLYSAALKSAMFSPLVLQMISVGEETGAVDELLDEVADFYDAEVEYDLKKLSSAIEPILIACIAGMVLILALGVFLPIWDLANAAR